MADDCDLFTWRHDELAAALGTPAHPSNHIEAAFWIFHLANPMIYELFCGFTRRAIAKGYTTFSVSMIIERIRWETSVETYDPASPGEFKLNNNYRAYYARLWMRDHPEWPNFFRTRTLLAGPVSEALQTV